MRRKSFLTPFVLPVAAFALTILVGALLLCLEPFSAGKAVPFIDALFIATSSVCVTGLATVDPSIVFNRAGQSVMLVLMQLGGLGIVTYSSLIFYMFSKRVSLWDRVAVGQALLHDTTFHLGRFLQRMVLMVLSIEAAGALILYLMEPERIGLFNAVFLGVSSFCNAGFALWPDNLMQWKSHWGVNLVIMGQIILGGLGFFVLDEVIRYLRQTWRSLGGARAGNGIRPAAAALSYYSRVVLATSFGLVLVGALVILCLDLGNDAWRDVSLGDRLLASLFQSVTSRTAGFATVDMAVFSDAALLATALLMFIGGSPGSCAGGIKTTSFRVLAAYVGAQLRGHEQAVVRGRAVSASTLNRVMLLFSYAVLTVVGGTMLLTLTENGFARHGAAPVQVMDLFFEAVSAFGTVGLSVNLTPKLSGPGKLIVCLLMFIGRLGPIWLVTAIQQFQKDVAYRYPEEELPIG